MSQMTVLRKVSSDTASSAVKNDTDDASESSKNSPT